MENSSTAHSNMLSISKGSRSSGVTPGVARPFVKWVGGKRSILNLLITRLPQQYGRYVEPFVGGGALFFTVLPENAYLSDINKNLILTYMAIRDNVDEVIRLLEKHAAAHSKEYYYVARENFGNTTNPIEIAALFIYLNKTCYNGLYRVNSKGKFNVPIGKYENPAILDPVNLHMVAKALQGVTLSQSTFSDIVPQEKDFFYLDPPYHKTYSQYKAGGFNENEHELLGEYCHQIDRVG